MFPVANLDQDKNILEPRGVGVEAFLHRQRAAVAAYRELPPSPDLAAYVACGWVRVTRQNGEAMPTPVIPDGCADLITCDDGAPVLVGPDVRARWPSLADNMVITGLRLRPGALRAVIDCPAIEFVDTSVRLSDLSGAVSQLYSDLNSMDTLPGRLALLEEWVRSRLRKGARDMAVIQACAALASQPHADVTDVATGLGWGARKAHREFVAACGYGPKTMQRILRVQRAIRAAHCAERPLRLIDLAVNGGFSDQAHMTREFRKITGFTPAVYLSRSEPALGRWLDDDWSEGPR